MHHIKCVVIGDGSVGKTCMMKTFIEDTFLGEYIPTVFDNYSTCMQIDGETVDLRLWDTAGQEDYDRLRPISYPHADVILICFSVDKVGSYEHVKDMWFPEVELHCPKTPVVLVGTKIDLREQHVDTEPTRRGKPTMVTTKQGQAMKEEMGAERYLECSALTHKGVNCLFEETVKVVLHRPPSRPPSRRKRRQCAIV